MDAVKKRKISHKKQHLAKNTATVQPLPITTNLPLPKSSDTGIPVPSPPDVDDDDNEQQEEEEEDAKPSAFPIASSTDKQQYVTAWQIVLATIPRCSAVEGIRETSFFLHKYQPSGGGGGGRNACLRKLLQELDGLEDSLPTDPAIWVRFDEETPQFIRAIITAPSGTPYALGLFCFDLYIPDTYPSVAPKVRLLTTGGGTVRFSPNLYENGTVCLSLLGTWSGPKWNPLHSTILQVLVSIQGLIFGVEHPYYLEPGFGGWEEPSSTTNKKGVPVPPHVKSSNAKIREGTVKYAMLETCRVTPRYLRPFSDVISAHFAHHKEAIVREVRDWGKSDRSKRSLQQAIGQLQEQFTKLQDVSSTKEAPMTMTGDSVKAGANGSGNNGEDPFIASKRHDMEQAAAEGNYVTAGQLQAEIQFIQTKGVDALVATKRGEMEEAAAKRDYITAGQLQQRVQYLEQHNRRLKELPRRMFEAAAKHDFVRAGRFQEQYQILLDSNDVTDPKSSSFDAASPAAMWDQGAEGGPSYTFLSSLPTGFSSGAGFGSTLPKPITTLHGHTDDGVDIAKPAKFPYYPPQDYGNY